MKAIHVAQMNDYDTPQCLCERTKQRIKIKGKSIRRKIGTLTKALGLVKFKNARRNNRP
jgi:hypothetical protein